MPRGVPDHGKTNSPEFWAWQAMQQRCYNPKQRSYPHYGGRGIAVYEPWRKSFAAFLAYVGPRPSEAHSLDRYPDNDGDYEPGNIRWATSHQQQSNRRPMRLKFGATREQICEMRQMGFTLAQITAELGVHASSIRRICQRAGVSKPSTKRLQRSMSLQVRH